MLPKVSAELLKAFERNFSVRDSDKGEENYVILFEIFDVLNQLGTPMEDRVVDLIFFAS